MVVFTCNNCGETLQKPRVAKHYQFCCRSTPFLTCVDCLKDFRGDEYVVHTKCITEAERYGGKDYVSKPNANKGEKKQEAWLNVVQNLLENSKDLSNAERNLLKTISKYENIPRKKAKFLNFIRNAVGNVNTSVIESTWSKMEAANKNSSNNHAKSEELSNGTAESNCEKDPSTPISKEQKENDIVENENNENIVQEKKNKQGKNKARCKENDADAQDKKKSRKRELSEPSNKADEESLPKKKCMIESDVNSVDTSHLETVQEKTTFDWRNTILNIVSAKKEISLNKLQKKVLTQYINHSDTVPYEKAVSKFNKKLRKISEIVISENKVRLA